MATGPREKAYDELVAPLMTQIIAICREHHISWVAQFELDTDEGGEPLLCTTLDLEEDASDSLRALAALARPGGILAFIAKGFAT